MRFHRRWLWAVRGAVPSEAWSSRWQESLDLQLALVFTLMAALAFQVLSAGVKAGWL